VVFEGFAVTNDTQGSGSSRQKFAELAIRLCHIEMRTAVLVFSPRVGFNAEVRGSTPPQAGSEFALDGRVSKRRSAFKTRGLASQTRLMRVSFDPSPALTHSVSR
jgi:hypothetical protein